MLLHDIGHSHLCIYYIYIIYLPSTHTRTQIHRQWTGCVYVCDSCPETHDCNESELWKCRNRGESLVRSYTTTNTILFSYVLSFVIFLRCGGHRLLIELYECKYRRVANDKYARTGQFIAQTTNPNVNCWLTISSTHFLQYNWKLLFTIFPIHTCLFLWWMLPLDVFDVLNKFLISGSSFIGSEHHFSSAGAS